MASRNNKRTDSVQIISSIVILIFSGIFLVVCTWGMYEFEDDAQLTKKILCNIGAGLSLTVLTTILTNMFTGETKRQQLAETTYDKLFIVVNQLLIKSETEKLTLNEFMILSQLSDIMGSLSKYCDVNVDVINNRYERLKNNPPQYINTVQTSPPVYGAVQVYDEYLVKQQHAPVVSASGSGAPPVGPTP